MLLIPFESASNDYRRNLLPKIYRLATDASAKRNEHIIERIMPFSSIFLFVYCSLILFFMKDADTW